MTFDELLINRRSVRKYKDTPVSNEVIKEMIRESTFAPNAGNEQPWIAADPDDYAHKYKGMLENKSFNVFYNAPCLMMILGVSSLKNLYVDCALAASYFMLAAASRGLGTCWVNLGTEISDPDMIHELGIPENHTIVAPITLGYPEQIPSAPKRKEPVIIKIIS
ncbi:MAG: nitroreductase family protein [Desulfofustis sp.]